MRAILLIGKGKSSERLKKILGRMRSSNEVIQDVAAVEQPVGDSMVVIKPKSPLSVDIRFG
ncbi:hypothetical protein, partial [Pseudomonas sp. CFBP 13715]